MTIYFVDEDYPKVAAWLHELEYRGYQVRPVGDADRAYALLTSEESAAPDLVIIDVMLSSSEQGSTRYPQERSGGGLYAGLCLLEDLCKARPTVFPERAVLLTVSSDRQLFSYASAVAEEKGVALFRKSQFTSGFEFGEAIDRLIREVLP